MTTPQTDGTTATLADDVYGIRPEFIEALGRSPGAIISERLCPTALAKVGGPAELRAMSFKQLRALARRQCTDDPEYLSPQAPVLESVFKLLLVAPNDGLALGDLHSAISDLWATSVRPRHISIEALARILTQDRYYGLAQMA